MELLALIVLIASPIAAGRIAYSHASACDQPELAQRRGLLLTWGLGIAFGVAGGLVIDVLSGGSMIPAFVAGAMAQFFISGVAGVIVGRRCARVVRARVAA
jgi:hypothetical protein